jgi:hypothetical protein
LRRLNVRRAAIRLSLVGGGLAALFTLLAATLAGGRGGVDVGTRAIALDLSRTGPPGRGRAYRPAPYGTLAAAAAPLGRLFCGRTDPRPYGVHLELFAAGRVVMVPAGIGVAPPQRRIGAVVASGRCSYPLRTVEPTGVVEVGAGASTATVGDLFTLWGQALDARHLAGFAAPPGGAVSAYLNGRRWPGKPRGIPLRRHASIVLEVASHVAPHPSYAFAPGL